LPKYEIWGDDGTGRTAVLSYVNGELPQVGDTILVRGSVRDVNRAWRHHEGIQATNRIGVGPARKDGDEGAG
jgi:ABC-type molybdenum transport system ATPase subunit/photorepair protein PhrA